jgi:D-beta-D-heptose 7-phosphate kinase / D-beta-D-heptose 1-phosphate adenosyltransferase
MPTRLIEIVESLESRPASPIVLVGDLMLDRYVYGNAERLSPDAPVPVLNYQREDLRLGGAGRVAADLATLGAEVRVVSLIGEDDAGREIRKLLEGYRCDLSGLVVGSGRPSTTKVRLVGLAQHRHPQQMMRLDYEDTTPVDGELARRVREAFERALDGARAVCLEDYNKGLLPTPLCKELIAAANRRGVPVLVDPAAIADYSKYAGSATITPNRVEAERATKLPVGGDAEASEPQWRAAAERLMTDLRLETAIITLDKSGIYLAERQGDGRYWVRGRERKVYDVAGAGDMVLAMLAVARAAGASWPESVALANTAAGLEVEKFGSVPITRTEIIQELLSEAHGLLGKRRTLAQLLPELDRHRAAGRRVVFTNGCFDLVHLGHVKYFQFAKKQGDLLVVGVNTDASIRRLKGERRPVINEEDRLGVLEELESIDYLVPFDHDTPLELIKAIRPNVLVKGADYAKEQVVGWDIVEAAGGCVALAPLVDGRSTSAVIRRILEAYGSDDRQPPKR